MTFQHNLEFKTKIQKTIANKLYHSLNWSIVSQTKDELNKSNLKQGVDFIIKNGIDCLKVKERFRRSKFKNYEDITFRYQIKNSKHLNNDRSEFFKTESDIFVYGIVNDKETEFEKLVIFKVKELIKLIDSDKVKLNTKIKKCETIEGVLNIPLKFNFNDDTNFIVVDFKTLEELNLVIYKK